jgi:hypothetical protein
MAEFLILLLQLPDFAIFLERVVYLAHGESEKERV